MLDDFPDKPKAMHWRICAAYIMPPKSHQTSVERITSTGGMPTIA
jgi:hypothetical protein